MKKQTNNTVTTKADLRKVEKSLRVELLRLEGKMESVGERLDENARKYRDEILTKLDGVIGELQTMREEDTVGSEPTNQVWRFKNIITALEK